MGIGKPLRVPFVKVGSTAKRMNSTAENKLSEGAVPTTTGGNTFVVGLVIGWLVVALWAGARQPGEPAGAEQERARQALGSDPSLWNARELRILPGIGERRALSAVEARAGHLASPRAGEPLPWEAVSGIGERTGSLVREDLERRGIRQLELWPGQ